MDKKEVTRLLDAWASAHTNGAIDVVEKGGHEDNWGLTPTLCNTFVRVPEAVYLVIERCLDTRNQSSVLFDGQPLLFCGVCGVQTAPPGPGRANRFWLIIWYIGVPAQVTALLVFALNLEARIVQNEVANGMVAPSAYLARCCPGDTSSHLPGLGSVGFAGLRLHELYGGGTASSHDRPLLRAATAGTATRRVPSRVAFPNPLVGAAMFIGCWFSGFLFAGFLIPVKDIIWPLRAFHHVFPLGNAARGMTYSEFIDSKYDACDKYDAKTFCFCDEDDDAKGCGGGRC